MHSPPHTANLPSPTSPPSPTVSTASTPLRTRHSRPWLVDSLGAQRSPCKQRTSPPPTPAPRSHLRVSTQCTQLPVQDATPKGNQIPFIIVPPHPVLARPCRSRLHVSSRPSSCRSVLPCARHQPTRCARVSARISAACLDLTGIQGGEVDCVTARWSAVVCWTMREMPQA